MNKEAFEQLLRVLRAVAENRNKRKAFDLGDWGTFWLTQEKFESQEKDLSSVPHNCGCTACACGYAGLDEWFRSKGFKTSMYGSLEYYKNGDEDPDTSWSAVVNFFEIQYKDAFYLFSHASYRKGLDEDSPEYKIPVPVEDVIKRVEEFIK